MARGVDLLGARADVATDRADRPSVDRHIGIPAGSTSAIDNSAESRVPLVARHLSCDGS